jgi:hypothetical protein
MKNISITLFATILLITGCVFDKKDLDDSRLLENNKTVVFSSEGRYDLKEYLFPIQNQTHIYERVKHKDNNGDKNYDKEPIRINLDDQVEYFLNENMILEGVDTKYTIKDISIEKKELLDDFYDIREYRRYVDIKDYYFSYEFVDAKSIFYQIGWTTCRVEEHIDSKIILDKQYTDILILGCNSESAEGIRGEFSEKKNFKSAHYFAKGIGEIAAIGEECFKKKYNQTYKGCSRTTKKLKEILN